MPTEMKLRLTPLLTVLFLLAMAVPAMAGDNGEGLVGETDDKIITFFSLGVVTFFFLVVCLGSYLQNRLEKRKEARKASELRSRIGW
jgi:Kef-type K+ transport system membrane component KefB